MEYIRITNINDPLFAQMHELMGRIFPQEEVLEFSLWKEPLEDPGIRVFVAVHQGEVVGATEYRYYADQGFAMTDFTIIGRAGLGIGRFLFRKRSEDLQAVAAASDVPMIGMFAEIYDPYRADKHEFGGIAPMNPIVRREVLSHLGYMRIDFPYVHPSWQNDGEAVSELDLCFMPIDEDRTTIPAALVANFLTRYYEVLPNKPKQWHEMIEGLRQRETVDLLPL